MTQTTMAWNTDNPSALLEVGEQVLAPTYGRPPILFTEGCGPWLRATDGREFLDMTSGIAVLALGHRSAVVAGALHEAAERLVHVSNLYHTAPAIELARRLVELSFADSVFFANSGAEAVEGAIKFARLAAGSGRDEIVFFDGSFHGRTLGALSATDRADYQEPFRPLPGGFVRAPWNSDQAFEAIGERTAAVLVEPIQGEMGVREADFGWLRDLRRHCDASGALLVCDEIQCGLGRSGELWAHEAAGITPDLMTLAKPLAGGLPIGAVLMTRPVAEALSPGMHGTTFGGGPLVTHVALRVLNCIADDGFLAGVRARGQQFSKQLQALTDHPSVLGIRGRGLMCGVQVRPPVKDVVDAAFKRQLLVVPSADGVIRLLPPLEVAAEEIDACIARLRGALDDVWKESS